MIHEVMIHGKFTRFFFFSFFFVAASATAAAAAADVVIDDVKNEPLPEINTCVDYMGIWHLIDAKDPCAHAEREFRREKKNVYTQTSSSSSSSTGARHISAQKPCSEKKYNTISKSRT